jgi:hypothetical protein
MVVKAVKFVNVDVESPMRTKPIDYALTGDVFFD